MNADGHRSNNGIDLKSDGRQSPLFNDSIGSNTTRFSPAEICLHPRPSVVSFLHSHSSFDNQSPEHEAFAQLAAATRADALLTHNLVHFEPARRLGIPVVTPREFLGNLRANA